MNNQVANWQSKITDVYTFIQKVNTIYPIKPLKPKNPYYHIDKTEEYYRSMKTYSEELKIVEQERLELDFIKLAFMYEKSGFNKLPLCRKIQIEKELLEIDFQNYYYFYDTLLGLCKSDDQGILDES